MQKLVEDRRHEHVPAPSSKHYLRKNFELLPDPCQSLHEVRGPEFLNICKFIALIVTRHEADPTRHAPYP